LLKNVSTEIDNPYGLIEAEIIGVRDETPNIKTLTLRPAKRIGFKTGQFMEVSVPGFGEGPFTPSSNENDDSKLDFTIMSVGRITRAIHQMKKGETLGLRGPYGLGYSLDQYSGKEILIVGGGVGLAPLRSLIYALFNDLDRYKKVVIKYGARTPSDIVYKDEIGQWAKAGKSEVSLTVDSGDKDWKGKVGLVTTILDDTGVDLENAVSVVCGPPIMMKFVTFKLIEKGFTPDKIYLSMEKNMSCGLGKCGHCRLGNFYSCKDGPVFAYEKIKGYPNIWD
jgi:sulfite reductase subunit B